MEPNIFKHCWLYHKFQKLIRGIVFPADRKPGDVNWSQRTNKITQIASKRFPPHIQPFSTVPTANSRTMWPAVDERDANPQKDWSNVIPSKCWTPMRKFKLYYHWVAPSSRPPESYVNFSGLPGSYMNSYPNPILSGVRRLTISKGLGGSMKDSKDSPWIAGVSTCRLLWPTCLPTSARGRPAFWPPGTANSTAGETVRASEALVSTPTFTPLTCP
jgi:hypothetical protein